MARWERLLVQLERLPEHLLRLLELALTAEHKSEVVERLGDVRVASGESCLAHLERFPVHPLRLLQPAFVPVHVGEGAIKKHIGEVAESRCDVRMASREHRLDDLERLSEPFLCLRVLFQVIEHAGEIVERSGDVRMARGESVLVASECVPAHPLGLLVFALDLKHASNPID